jgi:hypothetical protein
MDLEKVGWVGEVKGFLKNSWETIRKIKNQKYLAPFPPFHLDNLNVKVIIQ